MLTSDVLLPKQELSVEVADIDGVHVDQVDALEPHQGQVLEDLAPQAAGPND